MAGNRALKADEVKALERSMWTEDEFLSHVIALAESCGWKTYHARPARTARGWRTAVQGSGKGFCDLVLAKPGRGVLFRELKVDNGRLSPEQREWLATLIAAKADAGVWRPENWIEIVSTLKGTT